MAIQHGLMAILAVSRDVDASVGIYGVVNHSSTRARDWVGGYATRRHGVEVIRSIPAIGRAVPEDGCKAAHLTAVAGAYPGGSAGGTANLPTQSNGLNVTAYSNTWALGPLAPNKTATFIWRVTAVQPGLHIVAWEVAAGLNGKAKAVGTRNGHIAILIRKAPAKTYVTNSGKIVHQQ